MIIELKNVFYKYADEWILKNVSISFRSNEVTHIVGRNGSGKTTLMKIASLIYKPTKGFVIVDGENFWSLDEKTQTSFRRHVVYVHEKPVLIKGRVIDNVALGLIIRGVSKNKALCEAKDMLARLGIEEISRHPVHKLSIGLAQLVSIARALILRPKILFLDESFANLDIEKRKNIIKLLSDLHKEGMGIVIASHSEELMSISINKIITLENGNITTTSSE